MYMYVYKTKLLKHKHMSFSRKMFGTRNQILSEINQIPKEHLYSINSNVLLRIKGPNK